MSEAKTHAVTDIRGRKIIFRDLGVLEQSRLVRLVGRVDPRDAQNQTYLSMVRFAASVSEIDGVPTPAISKPEHIEPAIEQLGDEGYLAINQWFEAQLAELEALSGAAVDPLAAPKNSPGTPDSSTPVG
jgi:hypothetical protein